MTLVGAFSTDAQLVLNKRVKILLHCTVSDAAVERLNAPTMFPVLSFDRLFGIIRHYGNNVNPFHQKSITSIICIFGWFCGTNLSFIDNATNVLARD